MNNSETPNRGNDIEQRAEERKPAEDAKKAERLETDQNPEQSIWDAIDESKRSAKSIDAELALDNMRRQFSALEFVLPQGSRISREAEEAVSELPGAASGVSELMSLIDRVQTDGMNEETGAIAEQIGELAEKVSAKIAQITEGLEVFAQRLTHYTIEHNEALGNSVYDIEDASRRIVHLLPDLSETWVKLKRNADHWRTVADDVRKSVQQKSAGE
jgi:polyhydroxyalkanoate synthesis regulator phasin